MSLITKTSGLISGLRASVKQQGLDTRKDITAMSLSTESMDEGALQLAKKGKLELIDLVNQSVEYMLNTESDGLTFTAAQLASARSIAALAIDPASGMRAIASSTAPKTGRGALSVEAADLGVYDIMDNATLSTEAYDSQSLNNALYFSIAYNLFAAKQDAFGEGFFPTIAIDPAMSGISVVTEVTSLYNDFERTIAGEKNRSKFAKTTLAKAIYDNNLFGGDRNKIIPVSRAQNAAFLLTALNRVDPTTNITTAPLLMGKEANLMGISQTDAQLAKGSMDATDSLDRTLNLESIIVELTAVIATVTVVEHFRVPVGMLPHSNFTYTTQGEDKDLALAFDTSDVAFLTSATKQHNGATSAILATLPVGHKVKLHIKLAGDGNTQYGDVSVYVNVVEINSILDAAGNTLATNAADYVTIDTAFQTIKVVGYEAEAYVTNSNLRKQGQLVTIDTHEQLYSVPVRSGISVMMPVNSGGNDDSRLVGQVQTTGYRMSLDAVNTLVSFTDNLGLLTTNGANTDIALMGVGRHHVDAYYSEVAMDMPLAVDSESSADRGEDIREALLGTIRDEVYRAYSDSKYNVAHSMLNGGEEVAVGVIIGTSTRIKNYLTSGTGSDIIELGANFKAKVVSTANKSIGDAMYITFSNHMSADRNTKVDPISFGQCLWAPTITSDVAVSRNGATSRQVQTHPRFLHIVNLPIMVRINVVNLAGVLGKVARNTHTV